MWSCPVRFLPETRRTIGMNPINCHKLLYMNVAQTIIHPSYPSPKSRCDKPCPWLVYVGYKPSTNGLVVLAWCFPQQHSFDHGRAGRAASSSVATSFTALGACVSFFDWVNPSQQNTQQNRENGRSKIENSAKKKGWTSQLMSPFRVQNSVI